MKAITERAISEGRDRTPDEAREIDVLTEKARELKRDVAQVRASTTSRSASGR